MPEDSKNPFLDNPFAEANFSDENDPFPPEGESLTGDDRTEARLCAIQAMFGFMLAGQGETLDKVRDEFLLHEIPKRKVNKKLFLQLLENAHKNKATYEDVVAGYLNESWTLERLDKTMRSLLLVAITELYERPETPVKVVINEYVNLAKGFFDDKQARFVNGLLDAVAKKVRKFELQAKAEEAKA